MIMLFLLSTSSRSQTNSTYNKKYNWTTKPQIVLCDDAKVSKKDVQLAMEFWKDNSLDMRNNLIVKPCEKTHRKGEIRVTHQRDLDTKSYYAFTIRDIDYIEDEMKSATILIEDTQSNNIALIVHELGHALGLNHTKGDVNHIMHKHFNMDDSRFR